jgi:DNA-binding NarL/FixJ family response regulator
LDDTKSIRTLIVDDHPVIRYGVRHMLDAEDDIEVVGELESLQGIGAVLTDLKPDVVLLDLELEKTHGVDALRSIRDEAPGMHVIIYTSHDEDERIVPATCTMAARHWIRR